MKKRGQAAIITTVIIILIVIAGVVILWNVINPIMKKSAEQIAIDKISNRVDISDFKVFVTDDVRVSVSRTGNADISGIKFIFYDDSGKSYIIEKTDNIKEQETRDYIFYSDEINAQRPIKKVSVIPLFGEELGIESIAEAKKYSDGNYVYTIPDSDTNEGKRMLENWGVVSWWKFDKDYNDIMGLNNGTPIGTNPQIQNGILSLHGEDYIRTSYIPLVNFTASVWVNFNQIPPSIPVDWAILNFGNCNTGTNSFIGIHKYYGDQIRFGVYDSSPPGWNWANTTLVPNIGTWYNVIGVFDSSNGLKTYVNGEEKENNTYSGLVDPYPEMFIGSNGCNNLTALISNVMILNKSLSSDEVRAIYNGQKK